MKREFIAFAALSLFLFAGCASDSKPDPNGVRAGMIRSDLIQNFGEPVRMQHLDNGGENWYYPFSAWKKHATSDSGTINDFGERTTSGSVGLEFAKEIEEQPIHISPEGYVIHPLPEGKIVKK